jgi:hypothetical protein
MDVAILRLINLLDAGGTSSLSLLCMFTISFSHRLRISSFPLPESYTVALDELHSVFLVPCPLYISSTDGSADGLYIFSLELDFHAFGIFLDAF